MALVSLATSESREGSCLISLLANRLFDLRLCASTSASDLVLHACCCQSYTICVLRMLSKYAVSS